MATWKTRERNYSIKLYGWYCLSQQSIIVMIGEWVLVSIVKTMDERTITLKCVFFWWFDDFNEEFICGLKAPQAKAEPEEFVILIMKCLMQKSILFEGKIKIVFYGLMFGSVTYFSESSREQNLYTAHPLQTTMKNIKLQSTWRSQNRRHRNNQGLAVVLMIFLRLRSPINYIVNEKICKNSPLLLYYLM